MAFNSRGLQIGVIVTICVIIVGICIAWFVVVPMVIDQKVSDALAKASEKTGRHFEVSDIRLSGLSSARISRITISDVDVPDRPGLTVEDLKGLSPDEQFEKLAGAVASISDPTLKAAAMKIFGANGTNLLPLFAEGADGIQALRDEARKFGISIDDATAKTGAEYGDAMARATVFRTHSS